MPLRPSAPPHDEGDDSAGDVRLSHDEFAALVARHQHPLHAYLAGLLGTADQAADLVQETFSAAWQAATRGAPPLVPGAPHDEVRRWLFRVGSNDAFSVLRRRRLLTWHSLDRMEGYAKPPPALREGYGGPGERPPFTEQVIERDALRAALDRLPPQDAACLLLRIVHGFSAAETATILGTSPESIHTRLSRAKRRLRTAYIGTADPDDDGEGPSAPQEDPR